MRIRILTYIILLSTCNNLFAQIIGKTIFYDSGLSAEIVSSNDKSNITSNIDGTFSISSPKDKRNQTLSFRFGDLILEIKNVKNASKVNIGEITLPEYKNITVEEYEKLTLAEKEFCVPVYHWRNLLGYNVINQLSQDYISVKCGYFEFYKISDLEFDVKNRKVTIDWNSLKKCK